MKYKAQEAVMETRISSPVWSHADRYFPAYKKKNERGVENLYMVKDSAVPLDLAHAITTQWLHDVYGKAGAQ